MKDSRPHYLGHRGRLRRRFIDHGIDGLQDHEVLELLLTYCIARKDTKPLAKTLLRRFGSLSGVLDADAEELREVEGVGEAAAVLIKLSRSLLEIYMREGALSGTRLSTPGSVVDYLRVSMGGLKDEQFRALYLNSQNELLKEVVIQEGTVDQSVVYPRKVLEHALRYKASSVILIHNHPGGLLKPSRSDIELTERLKSAAEEMGIRVHDHFIITRNGYFSFHENGLL